MAFLDAIGNWLDGSGWTNIFERAKITTTVRIESYLSGSKEKRTRYTHEVSLASLTHLSILSYQKQSTIKNYATWKAAQRSHSVNAKYWFTVIEMEALYFMFIKSVRIGHFETFLECFKAVLPWFFALDHTQYSRWMPVFIKGFFTVRKTNCVFSNMRIDQAHKQNNKILNNKMMELSESLMIQLHC